MLALGGWSLCLFRIEMDKAYSFLKKGFQGRTQAKKIRLTSWVDFIWNFSKHSSISVLLALVYPRYSKGCASNFHLLSKFMKINLCRLLVNIWTWVCSCWRSFTQDIQKYELTIVSCYLCLIRDLKEKDQGIQKVCTNSHFVFWFY